MEGYNIFLSRGKGVGILHLRRNTSGDKWTPGEQFRISYIKIRKYYYTYV